MLDVQSIISRYRVVPQFDSYTKNVYGLCFMVKKCASMCQQTSPKTFPPIQKNTNDLVKIPASQNPRPLVNFPSPAIPPGVVENLLDYVRDFGFVPNGGRVYYLDRCASHQGPGLKGSFAPERPYF